MEKELINLKNLPSNDLPYISYHGCNFKASVNELKNILGEPNDYDYHHEWLRENSNKELFSVYVYEIMSKKEKEKLDKKIVWHIGTYIKEHSEKTIKEIRHNLKLIRGKNS